MGQASFWDHPDAARTVVAEAQSAVLSHISLWRDVYYINDRTALASAPVRGIPLDFPEHVAKLGSDEYFVMGDNSAVSYDARFWTDPISLPVEDLTAPAGCVPERFLLGKAFLVYWPAGYRPTESFPLGIIPNFGDMRFIH